MDMKKILQAFDGASAKKPVEGSDSMKKFLSIVSESSKDGGISKEKETKFHKKLDTLVHKTFGKRKDEDIDETVITSFDEESLGGEVNSFLLAADEINKKVMAEIDKIKINADQTLLKDLMDKFNAFMSAYDAVGKEILQPDLFNDDVDMSMAYKDYFNLAEAKKKMSAKDDPCWKGYKMVGTKKKGGREVPNCVPGKKGD